MSRMSMPVLLINASYEPMSIIPARDAFRLLVNGKVDIKLERDRDVRPGFQMPSVVILRHYVRVPIRTKVLTRKNVYMRDNYHCQYCDQKFHGEDLSWDHVLPRCQGGKEEWENLVTCCKRCNHRKAGRTPDEAGMPLLRRPLPRTVHTSQFVLRRMGSGMPEWNKYMFQDSEGETGLVHRA